MIRAVFFDAGGTLIQPWPSVGAVYARVAGQFGIVIEPARLEAQFRAAWKAEKGGALTVSRKDWWRRIVFRVFEREDDRLFEALYDEFVHARAWRVFPDVLPALAICRQSRVHVGVISNWDDRLRPVLAAVDLARHFDSVTISCEVGAEKPDHRVFETAVRAAGVPATAALHIGDSTREDVEGAVAVGMRAALVRQSAGEGLLEALAAARVGNVTDGLRLA